MKVRLALEVGDFDRFVIARYYGTAARRRATRAQVRQFAAAAVRSATRDRVEEMRGRTRAAARRLRDGQPTGTEPLLRPLREQQLGLF